jgi:hypothetical protein
MPNESKKADPTLDALKTLTGELTNLGTRIMELTEAVDELIEELRTTDRESEEEGGTTG